MELITKYPLIFGFFVFVVTIVLWWNFKVKQGQKERERDDRKSRDDITKIYIQRKLRSEETNSPEEILSYVTTKEPNYKNLVTLPDIIRLLNELIRDRKVETTKSPLPGTKGVQVLVYQIKKG